LSDEAEGSAGAEAEADSEREEVVEREGGGSRGLLR